MALTARTCSLTSAVLDYRKFGKHIQKRQLDIPEYAASFVDYKALKKVSVGLVDVCLHIIADSMSQLIKKLSTTPVLTAQSHATDSENSHLDAQASLQANKATFFFRLERELEKVNAFYLQKEAEVSRWFHQSPSIWIWPQACTDRTKAQTAFDYTAGQEAWTPIESHRGIQVVFELCHS